MRRQAGVVAVCALLAVQSAVLVPHGLGQDRSSAGNGNLSDWRTPEDAKKFEATDTPRLDGLEEACEAKGIDLNAKDDSGFTPPQQFFLAEGQNRV